MYLLCTYYDGKFLEPAHCVCVSFTNLTFFYFNLEHIVTESHSEPLTAPESFYYNHTKKITSCFSRQCMWLMIFMWVKIIVCVCCSILGMHIFGCKFSLKTEAGDTVPDRKNFDSLLWAIVTVFQVQITTRSLPTA